MAEGNVPEGTGNLCGEELVFEENAVGISPKTLVAGLFQKEDA
ncbi:MAG: hypothetical protein ACKODK_00500 [Opitutaceae bacterium]